MSTTRVLFITITLENNNDSDEGEFKMNFIDYKFNEEGQRTKHKHSCDNDICQQSVDDVNFVRSVPKATSYDLKKGLRPWSMSFQLDGNVREEQNLNRRPSRIPEWSAYPILQSIWYACAITF